MAFDTTTRNRLNKFVGDARDLLTDEFTNQCQVDYGLDPETGEIADLDRLSHLDDARRQTAIILRETLQHYYANLPTKDKKQEDDYKQLIKRIIREQAFTVLNRLCAIRMWEARMNTGGGSELDLIAAGVQSRGFQLYQLVAGNSLGDTGAAFQKYLFGLFDEFAVDLPVLFDRFSPQGRLFPRETVLAQLIDQINHVEINTLWAEDETIGWIYQYFNSKEERKAMRDASQAPRNSRELAVRNQFFTPRYVVEFLTDNTLGRIWYEMRKGNTRLTDECKYLVRRPDEVFFAAATAEDQEFAQEGVVEAAKQLTNAEEDEFPEFSATDDEQIQRMIDLSHTVSAYETANEADWQDRQETLRAGSSADLPTQQIFECLFMTCRSERHGGDGSVFEERWFIDACNEVRRRALHSHADDLSQEELLNQPVHIPHRPLKDPREIRMLDPACGSMHFGLYAFDLYLKIYEEYWDLATSSPSVAIEPADLPPLTEGYESRDAFLRDVPRLIIEHNIHGIDIDPRAVQIAGLSLWLRAQRAWKSQGLAAGDRPRVERSNVVCAEPMPGDKQQLEAFCKELHPAIAQMVTAIFEEMKLAGEAGSLLKIEQEISSLVAGAKKQFQDNPPDKKIQQQFFGGASVVKEQQMEFDLSGITDELFFEKAEEEIYSALQKYASESSKGGFRRKLFAGDAEKGFAFIELCQGKFDVALMNPPFGESSMQARSYVASKYPEGKSDILCCFVDRMEELSSTNGNTGVLSNRSVFFGKILGKWRAKCLFSDYALSVFADLGLGVLDDALVEAAAYTIRKSPVASSTFFRVLDALDKSEGLAAAFTELEKGCASGMVSCVNVEEFSPIPDRRLAYWTSSRWRNIFGQLNSFENEYGPVKDGATPGDDFRFLRCIWEVPELQIGYRNRWLPIVKGGDYAPYYAFPHLVFDWCDGKSSAKAHKKAVLRNIDFYGRPGLTYTERTTSSLSVRLLPAECGFTTVGQTMFPAVPDDALVSLGLWMSQPCHRIVEMCVGAGDTSQSGSAARHYRNGLLARLPVPRLTEDDASKVGGNALRIAGIHRSFLSTDEHSPDFSNPLSEIYRDSQTLESLALQHRNQFENECCEVIQLAGEIEELSRQAFNLSKEDIIEMERELGKHPAMLPKETSSIADVLWERYMQPVDVVINQEVARSGGSRNITKKSYYASRRLEVIAAIHNVHPRTIVDIRIEKSLLPPGESEMLAKSIVSFCVGLALGRWTSPTTSLPTAAPDLFAPVRLSTNSESQTAILESTELYLEFRTYLSVMFQRNSDSIETQLCDALNCSAISDYLNQPAQFFDEHLSQYSKSRRQAPIYWPISTESGSYTLWFYYHRLTDQTLYKAVNDFVDPKLKETVRQLGDLRAIKDRSSAQEEELGKLTELESELEQFKADLLEIAAFWKPNLNDGVQITAAPLHKFFRLKKWRDKLAKTWKELQDGKYDWAHLALSIWPDRVVREKCTTDRSIAIAHDMEDLLWIEDDYSGKWRRAMEPDEELAEQIQRHTKARFAKALHQLKQKSESDQDSDANALMTALATGTFEEEPLALTLWPQRVAKACWTDPMLAEKHSLKLPDSRAQAKKRAFIKKQVNSGAEEIADSLTKACQAYNGTFAEFWNSATEGEFDDQEFARWLWPDRVIKKCQADLAIVQAHQLGKYFWTTHLTEIHRPRQPIETEIKDEVERVKSL